MNTIWRSIWLTSIISLAALSPAAHSQLVGLMGPGGAEDNVEAIRLTVTPADEPVPAFKYRLSLRPHELVPGNSVASYLRAFPEGGIEKTWKGIYDKFGDEAYDWSSTPLSELPIEKLQDAAGRFESLVANFIGPGSRCRDTDWGVRYEDLKGPEVITFLLPEIQAMRSVSRAVSLQTRVAVAEHRYDDALDLMRMNYRLGRDVGQQPILVSGLVGMAISGITNDNVVELIAAPDSPNLYWALTELPRPQTSLRDAMRLELAIGPRMFELLDDPEHKDRSYDAWNDLWRRETTWLMTTGANLVSMDATWEDMLVTHDSDAQSLVAVAFGLASYSHAKERLLAWGFDPERVEQMPVGQVLAIYHARIYQLQADELEKATYVDFPTAQRISRQAQAKLQESGPLGSSADREILPIASLLLPAVQAAQAAEFRTERNLDALRVIEALRMHAAQHDGQWPKSLDEITCVPVPENVATGKPFEYHLRDDTAVLTLPESDGFPPEIRYELTIADDQTQNEAEGN